MKLYDFILKLNYEASQLPNMGMICDGDIYELNHYQNVKYPAFCATQLQHSEAGDWRYYQFNLFYVDRLTSSHGNAQQIQSAALDALSKIIRNMTRYVETQGSVLYDVFTERFDSECAGAYATVTFMTLVSDTCPDWFDFGWGAENIKVLRYTWTSRNTEAETPSMTNALEVVNQGDDPLDYGFESYFNLPEFIGNIVYQGRSNNGNNYSVVYTDRSAHGITWVNADWLIYNSATEGYFTSIDLSEADSPDCTLYISCDSNLRSVTLPDNLAGLGSLKNAGITNLTIPSSVTWMGDVFDGCNRITRANYRGTKEQFLAIPKSDNWSGNSTIQYIYCTDGRICLRDCEEGYTGATIYVANQINCREVEVSKVSDIMEHIDRTYLIARIGVPTRATRRTSDGKFVFVNDSAKDGMIVNNRIGRYPLFKLDLDEETGLYRFADAETGLWLNVTSGLSSFVSDVSGATLMGVGDGFIGVGYNDETGEYDYILGYNNDGLVVALPYGSDNTFDLYVIDDACGEDPYYGCTYDGCYDDECMFDCLADGACEDCSIDQEIPDESGLTGGYRLELVTGVDGLDNESHYVLADGERFVYVSDTQIDVVEPQPDYYFLYKSSGYTLTDGLVANIEDWAVFKLREPIPETVEEGLYLYLNDATSIKLWTPSSRKNIAFTYTVPRGLILQADGSLLNIEDDGRYLGYFDDSKNVGLRVPGYEGHKKLYLYKLIPVE